MLKDRLYTKAPKNRSRRSAQTAVYKITSALVRLAAPILVFTSEEIWKYLPKFQSEPESIHMSLFPEAQGVAGGIAKEAAENWDRLAEVRSAVLVALEQARAAKIIGGGLEAKVHLHAGAEAPSLQKLLEEKQSLLPALFIVSQVMIHPSPIGESMQAGSFPGLTIKIDRADGKKCDRCWNYSIHVGENARYPAFCERCNDAVAEIETSLGQASSVG
jgi:isoleucyl-tRNA synthetase